MNNAQNEASANVQDTGTNGGDVSAQLQGNEPPATAGSGVYGSDGQYNIFSQHQGNLGGIILI